VGQLDGRIGTFPANYVQVEEAAPTAAAHRDLAASGSKQVRVQIYHLTECNIICYTLNICSLPARAHW
jgi:hypothetical protein